MLRATAKRLLDSRNACLEIESYTAGKTANAILDDRDLQLILHKLLEIVGEALNQASKQDPELEIAIPDLRRVVSMRNRITHGYDTVNYAVIWRVASEEIPLLRARLDQILKDAPPLKDR